MLAATPIANYLSAMTVALKAEETLDTDVKIGFRFTDLSEAYVMHVRRGVVELTKVDDLEAAQPAATAVCASLLWKQILAKRASPFVSILSGSLSIEGSQDQFRSFVGWFEDAQTE